MKRIMSLILAVSMIISSTIMLTSCVDDECYACGGSGYYQKKDCPLC